MPNDAAFKPPSLPFKPRLQVLGEFFVAATGKIRVPALIAKARVDYLLGTFETFHQTPTAVGNAITESIRGRFS